MADMTDADTTAFLAELTKLSHKYGLGVAGNAELFILENEDESREYRIDDESRLSFS